MIIRPRRVFVSHTSELAAFPRPRSFVDAVRDAIMRAGDAMVDMSYFPAHEGKPAAYCRTRVAESDVYVGVIGFRYGSTVPDEPDSSFTEVEFAAATEARIPRLIFLLDESVKPPRQLLGDSAGRSRQNRFRERLRNADVIVGTFRTPDELDRAVLHALLESRGTRVNDPAERGEWRRPWMVPPRTGPVIPRPAITEELFHLLTAPDTAKVGLTTALRGAGGFGKTTLAAEVCRHPGIAESFPGGVLWVTIGEHLAGAELAAKVNDLSEVLSGRRPTVTDPEQAGCLLGELLGQQRRLLVVDDVWHRTQLRPFLQGESACVRLITTRIESVLPYDAVPVAVDVMEQQEARRLVAIGIDGLPGADAERLTRLTGRWPVLLTLVNRNLQKSVKAGLSSARAAKAIENRLAKTGPRALDVRRSEERDQAVAATVEVSLSLLEDDELDRYLELAVFPEDADIPCEVLEIWWAASGDLDEDMTDELCRELADLSLVSGYRADPASVKLHDVIRAYLRQRAGESRLRAMNAALLDALAGALLPEPAAEGFRRWWTLPPAAEYLWRQLGYHLQEAGEIAELIATARNLEYVAAKLALLGPASVEADLARTDDPVVGELHRRVGQAAHLLRQTSPEHALAGILVSRLDAGDMLAPLVEPFVEGLRDRPLLVNRWPLPDLPHAALRRVMQGHPPGGIWGCAASPDGTLLACADVLRTVWVWDVATGHPRVILEGHAACVRSCSFGPGGTWLASASDDRTVRVWDVATGQCRVVLEGHDAAVWACVVAPDGSWLASGDAHGTVRVWDTVSNETLVTLSAHSSTVQACAVAPDGSWLATADAGGKTLIWDTSHWGTRAVLVGATAPVYACVASPGGTWLATTHPDAHEIWIWDASTGASRAVLTGHSARGCVIGPDGAWLASSDSAGSVRVWDTATWQPRAVLHSTSPGVWTCAVSPDGSWLATADFGGVVRVWDIGQIMTAGTVADTAAHNLISGIQGCGVSPDSRWLACGHAAGNILIWDVASEYVRMVLDGHTAGVWACVFSPDGTWLASAGEDKTVRIWDLASGRATAVLDGHAAAVWACSISPDGTLLASSDAQGTILVRDTGTWQVTLTLTDHGAGIWACPFGPDGSWLASVSEDQTARIWDLATGQARAVLPHGAGVWMCAPSADGQWLATVDTLGPVRVWDVATGRLDALLEGHAAGAWWCTVDRRTGTLVSASEDQTLRVWDRETSRTTKILTGHASAVWTCEFSPDGAWLASADAGGAVRIWDATTWKAVSVLEGHTSALWACAASPDGTRLATGGLDATAAGIVHIRDVRSGETLQVLDGHRAGVRACAFGPDGAWLASADAAGAVRIWDPASWQTVSVLEGRARALWACAASPDGTRLATGGLGAESAGVVQVWDVRSGEAMQVLDGHRTGVRACVFGPDGAWLASADADGAVRIWDTADWQAACVLEGHTAAVWACAASPDGTWLATADAVGDVRIWDTATWQATADLVGHSAGVRGCAAGVDGHLATVDTGGTLRVWDVAAGECLTMMRVEQTLYGCTWLPGARAVGLVGAAGAYLFTFSTGMPASGGDGLSDNP